VAQNDPQVLANLLLGRRWTARILAVPVGPVRNGIPNPPFADIGAKLSNDGGGVPIFAAGAAAEHERDSHAKQHL
jgi:hypothetical protein